jgi:hypothetical protein
LLVVVGLTVLILLIGTHECARLGSAPEIMQTARASLARQSTAQGRLPVPPGVEDMDDEGSYGPGAPSLFGEGKLDPAAVLQDLLLLVGGDTALLFADTSELDELLAGEQYGEWGGRYRELAANPRFQQMVRSYLSAGQSDQ